jgi:hypothetical protein
MVLLDFREFLSIFDLNLFFQMAQQQNRNNNDGNDGRNVEGNQ